MTWVQDQLDDETLFPSKIGTHFLLTFPCFLINIVLIIVNFVIFNSYNTEIYILLI